jgi:hypothetical protein
MVSERFAMIGAAETNIADARLVACPQCQAQLAFCRSRAPEFDACGFESYQFDCKTCGAPLAGIIDPADETLLLTKVAS